MVTIVVCNQKGGVGKTSVATNMIAGFDYHYPEKRKLAIDLDPQGHSTFILHEDPNKLFFEEEESEDKKEISEKRDPEESALSLFKDEIYTKNDILYRTRNQNIDLIPSNILLFRVQQKAEVKNKFFRVKKYLKLFENTYDIVVIDTPPDLGTFVLNGLIAADYLLVPTDLELLSIRGINDLWNTYEYAKLKNPALKVLGILPNKYNRKIKEHNETLEALKKSKFKEYVLEKYAISTNAALSRAIASGKTIFEADKKARSYRQFRELTKWIGKKCGMDG